MSQERTAASRWMSRVTIGAVWVAGVVMTTVGGNDKPVNVPVGITGLLVFLGSSAAILYLCGRAVVRWLSSITEGRRERRQETLQRQEEAGLREEVERLRQLAEGTAQQVQGYNQMLAATGRQEEAEMPVRREFTVYEGGRNKQDRDAS